MPCIVIQPLEIKNIENKYPEEKNQVIYYKNKIIEVKEYPKSVSYIFTKLENDFYYNFSESFFIFEEKPELIYFNISNVSTNNFVTINKFNIEKKENNYIVKVKNFLSSTNLENNFDLILSLSYKNNLIKPIKFFYDITQSYKIFPRGVNLINNPDLIKNNKSFFPKEEKKIVAKSFWKKVVKKLKAFF